MTRIASVVWFKVIPPKFGGQKGIALFNKYLSQYYPLVCLCSKNNEPGDDLSYKLINTLPLSRSQLINPFCWRKIIRTAKKEKITHLILEHPYHGIAGWLMKKKQGVKLIIHSHNIEYLRFKQIGKWWWPLLAAYEKWAHRKADLNLFKTQADLELAASRFSLQPGKCIVVPFGIETDQSKPGRKTARKLIEDRHAIPADCKILLFSGTLDYEPNAAAVEKIVKEIAPALTEISFPFRILITGRNKFASFQYLDKLYHPNIIMAGEVDDIENYLAAADVFINPVKEGGGIQTKTLEAVSYNLNVVCYKEMTEGIRIDLCSGKLFIAEETNFTEKIIEAGQSSFSTPEPFFAFYDWKRITGVVADKISQL
jgi:polysaccharide biosynthesis protein PslH